MTKLKRCIIFYLCYVDYLYIALNLLIVSITISHFEKIITIKMNVKTYVHTDLHFKSVLAAKSDFLHLLNDE